MPDAARTRRSARTASAPTEAAIAEESGTSRAELRRRDGRRPAARPDVVWGRQDQTAESNPQSAAVEPNRFPAIDGAPITTTLREVEQPLTRRRARALAKPGVSTSADDRVAQADAATEPADAATVAEAEPVEPAEAVEPVAEVTAPFELLEPIDVPQVEAEPVDDEPQVAASGVDEFAAAARLFSFTGETPIQTPVVEDLVTDAPADVHVGPAHAAKKVKKARKPAKAARTHPNAKRIAAASFSVAVVGVVGLLTVGMTLPQQAIAAVASNGEVTNAAATQVAGDVDPTGKQDIQAYVAPAAAAPTQDDLDRTANYSTATLVELAGTTGISNLSSKFFTNNPSCPIQWPFAVGVPITYGFGPRPGEFHEGVDFTPGAGAHIQAIADGTVRVATESGGGYGVTIIIDHLIDGKLVSSRYAHMQHGSLQVHVGEKVQVGQYIGRTGNTGFSFGAHTHLEILQNGVTPIDPLPWLRAHATC